MIHPDRKNDHLLHKQGNGTFPEADSSETGENVVRIVGKAGVAVADAPQRSKIGEDQSDSRRVQEKGKDPIRVYLKEMGMVPLLSRGGEVEIAKRIEKGKNAVQKSLSRSPFVVPELLGFAERLSMGELAVIKLIRPNRLEEGREDAQRTVRRFEKEAQATAQLRSPHTVELYDFGVTHEQTFYYVMEYLNGIDLATLVKKHGPIPAPENGPSPAAGL